MKKFILMLMLISGCGTLPEEKTTHTECNYELVPDPSGSAKWKIVCIEVDNVDGDCGCFEDVESDTIGEKIEEVEHENKR